MPQAHFSPDLFLFLSQLKKNNRRPWFLKNKSRYEVSIKEPCVRFVTDFAVPLQSISAHIASDPRTSMFRIYRDIRFSHDKKPYKTHVGLRFPVRRGKEDVHVPGYYLHLEPGDCGVYAGIWHPDNPTLLKIREAIVARPEAWKKATRGWELIGDALSRPPRGFPCDHPLVEDLKHRDFMISAHFSEKDICSPKFMNEMAKACKKMSPLVEFLVRALEMKW